eukprot:5947850-Prymnesium_polylepis.1
MLAGRFITGVAGESLVTWQQCACVRWFAGPQESFSMGTALATQQIMHIGSAFPRNILPVIAEALSLDAASWCVVLYCAVCALCLGFYSCLERSHGARLLKQDLSKASSSASSSGHAGGALATVRSFSLLFWLECAFIAFVVTTLYIAPNFYALFLMEAYGMTAVEAANCTSLIYWLGVFAPVAGAITDYTGQRLWVQTIAASSALCGFAVLHSGAANPWFCMAWLGISFGFIEQNAYSLLARSMRVAGSSVATGYGIEGIFCNAGQAITPPIIAYVFEVTKKYSSQNLIYYALLGGGLLTSAAALVFDRHGILNMTSVQLEAVEESGTSIDDAYLLYESRQDVVPRGMGVGMGSSVQRGSERTVATL